MSTTNPLREPDEPCTAPNWKQTNDEEPRDVCDHPHRSSPSPSPSKDAVNDIAAAPDSDVAEDLDKVTPIMAFKDTVKGNRIQEKFPLGNNTQSNVPEPMYLVGGASQRSANVDKDSAAAIATQMPPPILKRQNGVVLEKLTKEDEDEIEEILTQNDDGTLNVRERERERE